jgi:N-acetylglucosamine-6-phosphate deacetylase
MDRGVENLMRLAGLSLREAVAMAARNPARVGRIEHRQRGLTPGDRADIVRFRYDEAARRIEILETYVSGERVYSSSAAAAC